ncbi:MAG: hypothetical protein N2C14_16335, partial [Planctomycetales bacterium]
MKLDVVGAWKVSLFFKKVRSIKADDLPFSRVAPQGVYVAAFPFSTQSRETIEARSDERLGEIIGPENTAALSTHAVVRIGDARRSNDLRCGSTCWIHDNRWNRSQ